MAIYVTKLSPARKPSPDGGGSAHLTCASTVMVTGTPGMSSFNDITVKGVSAMLPMTPAPVLLMSTTLPVSAAGDAESSGCADGLEEALQVKL